MYKLSNTVTLNNFRTHKIRIFNSFFRVTTTKLIQHEHLRSNPNHDFDRLSNSMTHGKKDFHNTATTNNRNDSTFKVRKRQVVPNRTSSLSLEGVCVCKCVWGEREYI